jgi:zinc transporter ZupT
MATVNDIEAPMRLAGRLTFASGVLAALGVAFLVAMAAAFAMGATSAGMVFGWTNDVDPAVHRGRDHDHAALGLPADMDLDRDRL